MSTKVLFSVIPGTYFWNKTVSTLFPQTLNPLALLREKIVELHRRGVPWANNKKTKEILYTHYTLKLEFFYEARRTITSFAKNGSHRTLKQLNKTWLQSLP